MPLAVSVTAVPVHSVVIFTDVCGIEGKSTGLQTKVCGEPGDPHAQEMVTFVW
jgi:hypothetical protein